MTDNTIFIALGISNKYLERTTPIRSKLPPGSSKISLDTSSPLKSLLLHFKQINKIKIELDGQPSRSLAPMHVSNYKATFSPIHLVFLESDTHRTHLDFKILDENNNEVIPTTFYLQLLNKNEYIRQWNQNLSSFYLIKMKVFTYKSPKEHCELYTETYGTLVVNSCQIEQKDIILIS